MMDVGASRSTLPLELVPEIMQRFSQSVGCLAACALVSRTFNRYATPYLYSNLILRSQGRLKLLFRTLVARPELALLLKALEIRVYPFGLRAEELEQLEHSICEALRSATQLEALCWTRTGSLNDRVLPVLSALPSLRHLEITGDARTWSPKTLLEHLPPQLESFAVVLPDRSLISSLRLIAQRCHSLKSFSVLLQHSAHLDDAHLIDLAKYLTSLERISLAGCRAVSQAGLTPLLLASRSGIRELALEGTAVNPSALPSLAPMLQRLRQLSLTLPRARVTSVEDFLVSLAGLVRRLPFLEDLTLYASSYNRPESNPDFADDSNDSDREGDGIEASAVPALSTAEFPTRALQNPSTKQDQLDFLMCELVQATEGRLRRLRAQGVRLSARGLNTLCRRAPLLSQLVVHVSSDVTPVSMRQSLSLLKHLSELHIMADVSSGVELITEDLRQIAQDSNNLTQVGFKNRVWEVSSAARGRLGMLTVLRPDLPMYDVLPFACRSIVCRGLAGRWRPRQFQTVMLVPRWRPV
ncbi:hypothetical protein IE81DRAFT_363718 [Ceraceosorus guamensis]|uniref:F-box domain-containing protein n=1 Tax=Ceraceosorus guamensis TaxID=1522189 RepID=A0A316W9Y9_9BASI|nr:hypothetical protein IE81DRAFT_363718 [Ceraceosorus guamensis]PWN45888.1 hypothetical protein IE81DRAFT_363718 [Ceraceosorus guamensis]